MKEQEKAKKNKELKHKNIKNKAKRIKKKRKRRADCSIHEKRCGSTVAG